MVIGSNSILHTESEIHHPRFFTCCENQWLFITYGFEKKINKNAALYSFKPRCEQTQYYPVFAAFIHKTRHKMSNRFKDVLDLAYPVFLFKTCIFRRTPAWKQSPNNGNGCPYKHLYFLLKGKKNWSLLHKIMHEKKSKDHPPLLLHTLSNTMYLFL